MQIAITCFYDVKPTRRAEHKIYPEIYALHSGKGHGAHAAFDFWPQRREKILTGDPRTVLDAINDCGITRLAVPEGGPREIEHRPKEEDAALDRIVTAVAYSPSGRVGRPDFSIFGLDRRTEYNPSRVLRSGIVPQPASNQGAVPIKEADPSFRNWLLARESDISEEERLAAERRRDSIRNEQGLVAESYRFISVIDALKRL
ncbi:hypothetical protein [Mesorhizobium silamurunense]|uniref:hypothetical protein n=1 Tax=Mesorhizobium silamurunense TaxID=499528 RepID=UPI00177F340F|nr:hypothetical protein [Mesorhizobium silamurunense]